MSGLVLVIDDESLVRWSLGERLRQEGYEILEAGSAAEARERIRGADHQPTVVLLDLRLPDADGLALFEELRTQRPGWPIIILSAHASAETAQAALQRGALHVGTKPFDLDDIVAQVRRGFSPDPA
jgi:DNA-binding NtrC family response regulator